MYILIYSILAGHRDNPGTFGTCARKPSIHAAFTTRREKIVHNQ